ncbi:MAG: formate dehydrogenase accessory sulfurtransferase FdhD [Firmicutes bacterium]|nr:formate dehydrogenase accessory sulfurtransferase FdhD [Bacillota bacterium]
MSEEKLHGSDAGKRDADESLTPALMVSRRIVKVREGAVSEEEDLLIEETPATLELNGREFLTFLCTPEHLDELAVGFLYSEGIIKTAGDVTLLRVDPKRLVVSVETRSSSIMGERLYGKRTLTSGCGRGTVFYQASDALQTRPNTWGGQVDAGAIFALMRTWQRKDRKTELFATTGAAHSAALWQVAPAEPIAGLIIGKRPGQEPPQPELLVLREDIGRHNAVDKVIGRALLEGWPMADKLLATTGRVSSEIVVKAAKGGVAFLVSRSAPTNLGVDFADKLGITLIGFVRGRKMNIYTHAGRVRYQEGI